MKKVLVLLLAVLCIFTFVACEASPSNSNNDSTEVTPPAGGGSEYPPAWLAGETGKTWIGYVIDEDGQKTTMKASFKPDAIPSDITEGLDVIASYSSGDSYTIEAEGARKIGEEITATAYRATFTKIDETSCSCESTTTLVVGDSSFDYRLTGTLYCQ